MSTYPLIPPPETVLVSPALASAMSGMTPYEMRDVMLGDPPLARSAIVGGRRLVELRDILELVAIAALLPYEPADAADDLPQLGGAGGGGA